MLARATVGGEFWSARLSALQRAESVCAPLAAHGGEEVDGGVRQGEPAQETEVLDALALLSLDGSALAESFPASCDGGCVRPPWRSCSETGRATLDRIAAVRSGVVSVESGDPPILSVHMLADADVAFTCAGLRWSAQIQSDYPWSGHLGVTLGHEGAEGSGAAAALDVRISLPAWLDPSAVRVSARGQMLSPGEIILDGRTLIVPGPWADGDRLHVSFPMEPREVESPGGIEIWRGPLRYVAESIDQPPGALADASIARADARRVMPLALAGASGPGDAGMRDGAGAAAQAGASAAPQGVMAVIVERRGRALPSLVLVPLVSAGNRGDCPRVGTFARPAGSAR